MVFPISDGTVEDNVIPTVLTISTVTQHPFFSFTSLPPIPASSVVTFLSVSSSLPLEF